MSKRKRKLPRIDRAFLKVYKEDALRKNDMECPYCFRKLRYKESTIEHLVSKRNGGSDQKQNVGASCSRCNTEKGSEDHNHFLSRLNNPIKPFSDMKFISLWIDRRINKAVSKSVKRIQNMVR